MKLQPYQFRHLCQVARGRLREVHTRTRTHTHLKLYRRKANWHKLQLATPALGARPHSKQSKAIADTACELLGPIVLPAPASGIVIPPTFFLFLCLSPHPTC
mmetsp:Transcript_128780/g.411762  ORF Transcript_128780/g.411762 Transcript_128780/m.411762 type:complete len:102 (-) Transcript_128780:118-423(-)